MFLDVCSGFSQTGSFLGLFDVFCGKDRETSEVEDQDDRVTGPRIWEDDGRCIRYLVGVANFW